jgi:arabinofuranan 3-O-arabinosyltransferase
MPPLRTNEIALSFPSVTGGSGNMLAGQPRRLPLGLARLRIPALRRLRPASPAGSARFDIGCGQGPSVSVDGQSYRTSVSGTISDLAEMRPVLLQLCAPGGALSVSPGQHWLLASPSAAFTVTGLSLQGSPGSASTVATRPTAGARQLHILSWRPDSRSLSIGPGAGSYVEIHENFNPGWTATMNGHRLAAVTLDGWQSAFIVPAGRGGTIALSFAPATVYHIGIVVSVLALAGLIAVAAGASGLWRHRRRSLGGAAPIVSLPAPGSSPVRLAATREFAALIPLTGLMFLVGGAVAAVIPILAILRIWRPRTLPGIALLAMLAAGLAAVATPHRTILGDGVFSGFAQACALISLATALMPAISMRYHARHERLGPLDQDAGPQPALGAQPPPGIGTSTDVVAEST